MARFSMFLVTYMKMYRPMDVTDSVCLNGLVCRKIIGNTSGMAKMTECIRANFLAGALTLDSASL